MPKNKLVAALISVLVAFGLWLYVITVVSPGYEETFDNIPVILRNEAELESRGFMVVSEELPTVTLTLSGNRTDLAKVNRSNISLIVDLATIYERGTHKLSFKESFPGSVADDAIKVEYRYPSQIELEVELLTKKDIPVNVNYTGNVPANFIADTENVVLDNANIHIEGPDPVVQKITQAVVEVDLAGRSESFGESYRYTLCDAQGQPVDASLVKTNVAEVNLALKIQRFKEITLAFEIIDGGGATKDTSSIEYEPKTIKIAGSEAALESVADQLVIGTINLGELKADMEWEVPINLPGSVTNLSNVESVNVSVKFLELITKTFMVTNFAPMNVPEGLEAEIVNRALSVTVRGPQELVETMTEDDITIMVDFSQAQLGTFTVKANVVMDMAYSKVGAIGTYQVSATLREPKP